jgi:hypothetical protein
MISGFRRDVDDICLLVGYYAASCGNCLTAFWDNVSVPSSRGKNVSGQRIGPIFSSRESETDALFRNVGKQLSHDAA